MPERGLCIPSGQLTDEVGTTFDTHILDQLCHRTILFAKSVFSFDTFFGFSVFTFDTHILMDQLCPHTSFQDFCKIFLSGLKHFFLFSVFNFYTHILPLDQLCPHTQNAWLAFCKINFLFWAGMIPKRALKISCLVKWGLRIGCTHWLCWHCELGFFAETRANFHMVKDYQ